MFLFLIGKVKICGNGDVYGAIWTSFLFLIGKVKMSMVGNLEKALK